MSIIENIFVGQEHSHYGFMNFHSEHSYAKDLCDNFGIELDLKKLLQIFLFQNNNM